MQGGQVPSWDTWTSWQDPEQPTTHFPDFQGQPLPALQLTVHRPLDAVSSFFGDPSTYNLSPSFCHPRPWNSGNLQPQALFLPPPTLELRKSAASIQNFIPTLMTHLGFGDPKAWGEFFRIPHTAADPQFPSGQQLPMTLQPRCPLPGPKRHQRQVVIGGCGIVVLV
ncbi:hypothetical protein P7K49_007561 [Saguinus oedipus]|uniref:Uncharacterized protein n=1 Tax=Saguinus oedipus TaxID=9490 RepID=A0ABQ9VVY6_SAGOE|nr:hypothetical protein P7K49_007561 [Saguinus oedipus]